MSNDTELKPCPFCGGEVKLIDMTHDGVGNPYSIQCDTDWCLGHTGWYPHNAKDELIEKWNTRTGHKQDIEELENNYKIVKASADRRLEKIKQHKQELLDLESELKSKACNVAFCFIKLKYL